MRCSAASRQWPRRRQPMKSIIRTLVVLLVCAAGCASDAGAQTHPPANLAMATLEDLLTLEVTSAARKEQRLADVPSAMFVITQDDIRRSGLTAIAELLRLAPGVQ